jgi:AcrR family transcriptional regulator
MRTLAATLGVRAPTLYWHVKNNRELLDAMADAIAADSIDGLRPRRPQESIEDWLADMVRPIHVRRAGPAAIPAQRKGVVDHVQSQRRRGLRSRVVDRAGRNPREPRITRG